MKTLIPKSPKISDKEAIKFLESRGYLVVKVPTSESKALINEYYKVLAEKNRTSEILNIPDPYQDKRDTESLNRFYKRGRLLGYSSKEMHDHLKTSINRLLELHQELNIRLPDKFSVLLSSRFSFIFKAVSEFQKKEKSKVYRALLDKGCEPSGEAFEALRLSTEKKLLQE